MLPVEPPFKVFTGLDGKPLDNGSVYIGVANQNPVTVPLTVYWDADGTQPALQPLPTLNGYIVRAGTPANVYVDGEYSVLVKAKNGSTVFYHAAREAERPVQIEVQTATAGKTVFTLLQITYTPGIGSLHVYLNGLRLHAGDFTETSPTVVTFASGLDVGDEVMFEAGSAVNSRSAIDSLMMTYLPAGAGAVQTNMQAKMRQFVVTAQDKGAVGDGVANDAPAILLAQTQFKAVEYPYGDYVGQSTLSNLYGSYLKALAGRIQSGTPTVPLSDPEPVAWFQKFSSADRAVNPSEWDNGAVYAMLVKRSGAAYGAGVTGAVRHEAGTGQMIGVHGRGNALHANAQVWGGWSYVVNTALGSISMIGHEINVNNSGADLGWQDLTVSGNSRGLVIVTADAGTTPAQHAVYIGRHTGTGGWYTGFLNKADSIQPTNEVTEIGNGEIIRLKGSTSTSDRYGGIRFHTGHFQYCISTAEIAAADLLSSCAILLAKDHRIVFGTRPTNGTYLTWTAANLVNAQGAAGYAIAGTQVVSIRKTGWAAATGTADKTTFATYTAPVISAGYVQAEVQALADAVQVLSQHTGAAINDLINHGLFGA